MIPVLAVPVLLAAPACSSGGTPSPEPTKSVSAEEQILGQYKRLWTETLPEATAADAKARKTILATTLTGPALSRALAGLQTLDDKGQTQYGKDVPLRQSVRRSGKTAVVSGCLDSSNAGAVDRRNGRKINKGPATNPVTVTFTEGPDGVWRVSDTEFGNSKKC
jgi:hypothetical protein